MQNVYIPFCLSGKAVVLYPDNSTAKAYLCNQNGIVVLSYSRLACHILTLAFKQGISLIPVYIPTHLNTEGIFCGVDWFQNTIFSSHS